MLGGRVLASMDLQQAVVISLHTVPVSGGHMVQPGPHISVGGNVGGHLVVGDYNTVTGGGGPQPTPTTDAPGDTPPGPVHRAIVCVDIESFGDQGRTDAHRLAARDGLYAALRTAFGNAGIPWASCHHEDRGDGALILVEPAAPKPLLVTRVPQEFAAALAAHNALHVHAARLQVRVSVHAGEVSFDGNGVVSDAINHAFRILEAQRLKLALRDSPGVLALVASEWFFTEVVRHAPAAAPASYLRIPVSVKETETTAWMRLFGEGT